MSNKHRDDLTRGVPLPSTWVNALMDFVGTLATNFRLTKSSATQVQIVAATGNDQVSIGVGGKWRFNTATLTATAPAVAAGVLDVYVTSYANDLTAIDPLDNTTYTFGLVIRARVAGAPDPPPTGTASSAFSRRIGEVTWNGAAITGVYELLRPEAVPLVTALHPSPRDGQVVDYQATTTDYLALAVIWRFRYRAASASPYKWECIGGEPMLDFQGATSNLTVVGSVDTDMPNVATLTVPLAGDWDLEWQISIRALTASGINGSYGFPPVGSSPGGLAWGMQHLDAQATAGQANLSAHRRLIAVAAGTVFLGRYAQIFTSQVYYRSVQLMPVRVG